MLWMIQHTITLGLEHWYTDLLSTYCCYSEGIYYNIVSTTISGSLLWLTFFFLYSLLHPSHIWPLSIKNMFLIFSVFNGWFICFVLLPPPPKKKIILTTACLWYDFSIIILGLPPLDFKYFLLSLFFSATSSWLWQHTCSSKWQNWLMVYTLRYWETVIWNLLNSIQSSLE